MQYRCKFDTSHANLPECPLANLRCHSPCDIDARSFGVSFAYPNVIETPDGETALDRYFERQRAEYARLAALEENDNV